MTPERWQRVKELFEAALAQEPEARAVFLARAAPEDPPLAEEVLGLLASDEKAGAFLSTPPSPTSLGQPGGLVAVPVGRHVGPYRILGEIAQGGMGAVYRAIRDEDQKQVAIKLIRGGIGSDFVIKRFRAERQILASLEHPNIARLIDGGTTEEGWPWFSMEYVEGRPIDAYCGRRGFSTRQRLEMFRTVCAAVQYAHQRLVIHRDLKPGNILVTEDGTPKLLDFGIAKLLSAEPGQQTTLTGWPQMTPEYASPEQVKGHAITTASDVYSLGVLLYELLAGSRPFEIQGETPDRLLHAICETEPERPSSAARRDPAWQKRARELDGDLDTILLKALRKEPGRRYGTAQEFSEDLRRHLDGLPVAARKDTLRYRAGKFIRRHRAAVAAACLAAASLAAGATVAVDQARVARAERARAERRFNDVRKLANAVVGELHDAIQDLPGATPARKLLVTRAAEYLDSLAGEAGGDESLQRELADAYDKIGDAQGDPYGANLGEPAAAWRNYQRAFEIHAALAAAHPDDPDLRRDLAAGHNRVGKMLYARRDYPAALDRFRIALGIYQSLAAADPTRLADRFMASRVLSAIAHIRNEQGDFSAARQTFLQTVALMSGLAAAVPGSVAYRRGFAVATLNVGIVEQSMHNHAAASARHRESERMLRQLSLENPANGEMRRAHALVLGSLAISLVHLHQPAEAVAAVRNALVIGEALAKADPENVEMQFQLAFFYGTLSEGLRAQSRYEDAADAARRGVSMYERAHARDPALANEPQNLANLHLVLGAALLETNCPADALKAYQKAASMLELEPLRSRDPSVLADAYARLGDAQARLAGPRLAAQCQAARQWYQKSLAVWVMLRDQGKLPADRLDRPKQIEQRIERCIVALASGRR